MCAFPRKITYTLLVLRLKKKSEGKTTHECVIIFRRRCSYFSAFSIIIRWPWKITLLLSLAISLPVVKKTPTILRVCVFLKVPTHYQDTKKGCFMRHSHLLPKHKENNHVTRNTAFFCSSLFKTLLDTNFTWSTKKQAYRMTAAHSLSEKGDKNKRL